MNHGRMPLATRSAVQRRISSALCTESFQRYASSTPTLKRPATGFPPTAARYSLAFMPMAQGAMRPRRAWRSATSIGARSPIAFMSSWLVAPPPVLGMTQESGLTLRTSESHRRHRAKSRSSRHCR